MPGVAPHHGQVHRWVLPPVVVVFGLVVERVSVSAADVTLWLPDLLVGLALIGSGSVAWPRQRGTGTLLGLSGFFWFLGTLWPPALFLHVGPIVHVLVTGPGVRAPSRALAVVVGCGYLVAIQMPRWPSETTTVMLAVALVVVLVLAYRPAGGPVRRERLVALRCGCVLAADLLAGAVLRTAVPEGRGVLAALLVHEVAVAGIAVTLAQAWRPPPASRVADLVVELGEVRSGTLRDALATTLRDPTLQVGYHVGDGRYVDVGGRAVDLPQPAAGRTATFVDRGGGPFAVLVHDAGLLEEPALLAAVTAATRLAASHTALRAELDGRVAAVRRSRRRLLVAGDDEQARLGERLREGADRRLIGLDDLLQVAAGRSTGAGDHIERARQELGHTRADLRTLAQGLRPPELDDGLLGAISALGERSPLPLQVTVPAERYDADVEATAWFVCAEAVTNAVKHAGATSAAIRIIRRDDQLVLTITDDGAGGADDTRGSGLRGLADRVEALGGRLAVDSAPARGTSVTAELPLGRHRG